MTGTGGCGRSDPDDRVDLALDCGECTSGRNHGVSSTIRTDAEGLRRDVPVCDGVHFGRPLRHGRAMNMGITSFAQNFEDVMLWRALGHIRKGYYVDVGAHDPCVDSVSLAFYQQGWSGIHIEPVPEYVARLRSERPRDLVLQAAVGAVDGTLTLFEFPGTGLTTADPQIAAGHRQAGFPQREATVPCVTLDQVFAECRQGVAHWLKIDVEGHERQVLEGWRVSAVRPWIVVVESTAPGTRSESHHAWEPLLLARGYEYVYFDGLNRFYVSSAHPELRPHFAVGPNVFDGFVLSGTASASFCALLNRRIEALEARLNEGGRESADVARGVSGSLPDADRGSPPDGQDHRSSLRLVTRRPLPVLRAILIKPVAGSVAMLKPVSKAVASLVADGLRRFAPRLFDRLSHLPFLRRLYRRAVASAGWRSGWPRGIPPREVAPGTTRIPAPDAKADLAAQLQAAVRVWPLGKRVDE